MKELSIEEKAKAYDEAIKRAKAMIPVAANQEEIYNSIITIFPELKESGNIRIIKAIKYGLDHVFTNNTTVFEVTKEQCLAWLEKQGENHIVGNNEMVKPIDKIEQKPVVYIPKFHVGDKLVSTYNTSLTYEVLEVGHINGLGNPDYKVEIFTDGKAENPRNIHYMECYKVDEWAKLIEQKHAWSEEDEAGLGDALWAVQQARTLAKDENDMGNLWYAEKWLNSLKGRLQPNQYWSKEDEKIYQSILDDTVQENQLDDKQTDWLKSLKDRVQPKQEWSEEDESYLNTTIAYLKDAKEFKKTAENCINWLKSLRPKNRWRPSDEQILALNYVVNLMASSESPKENDYYYNVFKDLREQLKKLKQ